MNSRQYNFKRGETPVRHEIVRDQKAPARIWRASGSRPRPFRTDMTVVPGIVPEVRSAVITRGTLPSRWKRLRGEMGMQERATSSAELVKDNSIQKKYLGVAYLQYRGFCRFRNCARGKRRDGERVRGLEDKDFQPLRSKHPSPSSVRFPYLPLFPFPTAGCFVLARPGWLFRRSCRPGFLSTLRQNGSGHFPYFYNLWQ